MCQHIAEYNGYALYFNCTFAYEIYYYGINFYDIYFYGLYFYKENTLAPKKFF